MKLGRNDNVDVMEKEKTRNTGRSDGERENKLRGKPTVSANTRGVGKHP